MSKPIPDNSPLAEAIVDALCAFGAMTSKELDELLEGRWKRKSIQLYLGQLKKLTIVQRTGHVWEMTPDGSH